jgi:hypothetical protein
MLAEFGQMTLDGQAFDKCTGCSPAIVAAYEKSLPELLIGACNIPNYLEDLSGLSALHDAVDELEDWDNDEDDFWDSIDPASVPTDWHQQRSVGLDQRELHFNAVVNNQMRCSAS